MRTAVSPAAAHLGGQDGPPGDALQPGKEVDEAGGVDQGPGVAAHLGIVSLALRGQRATVRG